MKKEIECKVVGRVQMVMYRDFAMRKATAFGITGTVTNMPDRSVIVVAQGEKEKLIAFITLLKVGSLLSHVADVAVVWRDVEEDFNEFKIIY